MLSVKHAVRNTFYVAKISMSGPPYINQIILVIK